MRETDSIRTIKGVGEKTEGILKKLDLYTVNDLISYYPREYDIYEKTVDIGTLADQEKASIMATVTGAVQTVKVRGLTIVSAQVSDSTGSCKMVWFNMPYLRNTIKRGMTFVFRGRAAVKNGRVSMDHPEMYTPAAYEHKLNSMQPVYGLTAGISNNSITKMVKEALNTVSFSADYIPDGMIKEKHLISHEEAVKKIHFPADQNEYLEARKRLSFEEFLLFLLALQKMKEHTTGEANHYPMKETQMTDQVLQRLPYDLTGAQKKVWKEICGDLTGNRLMARLVQGDVGSGKTILAFLAMIMAAENGYQSALMVPTEVLARQHFEALSELLKENDIYEKYHPVLLTGSNTAREKRDIYDRIKMGMTRMVIGTHALIQEKVEYENLSLVITDEQHRFGVCQRETFSGKGNKPNILVMSATPIPRTLGIILYGDLDISVIDELPSHRLPIKNCVVGTDYRPNAYRFIENQVQEGRQVYVICPMVEESEEIEGENVVDYTKTLKGILPSKLRVEMLHGQMKAAEKNRIMEEFAAGEIQVLVSTTVVEVGVNVPNATVMMVENAERFGLAQLHQLRGRVGRGKHQSYCIFVHGKSQKNISKRLKILERTNDGFRIAEEDLKLRGPGDLFGIRQSGVLEFKIADIFRDAELLKDASKAAGEILAEDYGLEMSCHSELKKQLDLYTKWKIQDLGL